MLSVKQGCINYHFLSLWYDSTWDWTLVSWTIGERFTYRKVWKRNDEYQRIIRCKYKPSIHGIKWLLLILVDQFLYLGSNILPTESDMKIRMRKTWAVIDKISKVQYLIDQKKWNYNYSKFSPSYYYCMILTLTKRPQKKAKGKQHTNAKRCSEEIFEAAPNKTAVARSLTFHLTNYPKKICWASLEWRSLMDSDTETYQWWLSCKNLHSSAQCGPRMLPIWQILSAMTNREE